jgi:hypothetical protein
MADSAGCHGGLGRRTFFLISRSALGRTPEISAQNGESWATSANESRGILFGFPSAAGDGPPSPAGVEAEGARISAGVGGLVGPIVGRRKQPYVVRSDRLS